MKSSNMHNDVLNQVAQVLLDTVPKGSRVVLFGSHARGMARPDSDIDFLVIEPEVKDRFAEIFRLRKSIENSLGDIVQPIDLIVTDEKRYRQNATVPNTLAYEAANYGHVYE